MAIDPQVQVLLQTLAASGEPPVHARLPAETRRADSARRSAAGRPPRPERLHVEDLTLPGPAGPLGARYYVPAGSSARPVVLYFHGGGWVLGDLDMQDGVCATLADRADCLVVSVDYRLAPEHPFPAGFNDAYAAVEWAAAHTATLGGDPTRLALAGSSAGGNLAAAVALAARDRGGPPLSCQVLLYPVLDHSFDTSSYSAYAAGFNLSRKDMEWYWRQYLQGADGRQAYASPLRAPDLSGLPPAIIVTAEFDPLRDEGQAYAERLRNTGVPTRYRCYPGMIHGFIGLASVLDRGREGLTDVADDLRQVLEGSRTPG